MDHSLVHTLNQFFLHHDAVEDPIVAYVKAAEYIFVGIVALMFLLAYGRRKQLLRRAAVAATASAGISLVLAYLIANAVGRERPFVAAPHSLHLFASHAADPGFPSDHATGSFAIATAVALRSRRWGIPLLILAAILCFGRVAMAIHYPSDVIAGAALGAAVAIGLWLAPLRRWLDALADWAGGVLDRVLGREPRSAQA